MAVRLIDVAKRANVSPGLVSKVINNRSDVRVPIETRQRIVRLAEEMGYYASASARSLRSGKTRNVALVFCRPEPGDWSQEYGIVAGELARYLNQSDHFVFLQSLETQEQTLIYLTTLARSRTCDLVVLWDTESYTREQGQLLEKLKMPFVVKGRFEQEFPHWPQIDFDHEQMMRQAVSHLVEQGHRRIAYLAYANDQAYTKCLRDSFSEAMETLAEGSKQLLVVESGSAPSDSDAVVAGWLALPSDQQPTAIVVGGDTSLWESIELGLARQGRRIGTNKAKREVAVVGTASSNLRLLFGEALFMNTDACELGNTLTTELIAPLLAGESLNQAIHHYCPVLQPVQSQELQHKGISPLLFPT